MRDWIRQAVLMIGGGLVGGSQAVDTVFIRAMLLSLGVALVAGTITRVNDA